MTPVPFASLSSRPSVTGFVADHAKRALLEPRQAARAFLAGLPEDPEAYTILETLLSHEMPDGKPGPLAWTDALCDSFDQMPFAVLVKFKTGGRVWWAPKGYARVLMPHAPAWNLRSLRALARGLVEELAP